MKKGLLALVCLAILACAPACKKSEGGAKKSMKNGKKHMKKTRGKAEKHSKNMSRKAKKNMKMNGKEMQNRYMNKAGY